MATLKLVVYWLNERNARVTSLHVPPIAPVYRYNAYHAVTHCRVQ